MKVIRLVGVIALLVLVNPIYTVAQTPQNGRYKARYADSTLKETGYFTNGLRDKRWNFYNTYGFIERKEKWTNGQLQWQIFYNNKGKITRTIDKKGKETIRPACGC
jgi:antitoxin component YwqK of YwqJK toxin-antitoxin module